MDEIAAPSRPARTPLTWILIAANVAMFAYELTHGVDAMSPTAQQVLAVGGDFAPYTLRHGEWWRLATSMFLHFGVIHIAMNMIVLAQGRIVEQLFGTAGFGAIYLAAGLLGAVTSLWHAQFVVSAGASGAVFGVFGAFGAFLLMRRQEIDPDFWQKRARALATFIGINFVYGFTQGGIDMSAHIGGLCAGFVFGVALLAGRRANEQRALRAIIATVVALGLTVVALVVMPKPFDFDGEVATFAATEKQCLDAYSAGYQQLQKEAIKPEALADLIERDVLPPWHAMRVHFDGLTDVPSLVAGRIDMLRGYLADREGWFSEYDKLLRGQVQDHTHLDELEKKIEADMSQITLAAAGK